MSQYYKHASSIYIKKQTSHIYDVLRKMPKVFSTQIYYKTVILYILKQIFIGSFQKKKKRFAW